MELIGKIIKNIDDGSGFIVSDNGKQYFFLKNDIIDDTEIIEGTIVAFKPDFNIILRATYISSI